MHSPDLAAALLAGTTVVTPNKRLARHLVAHFDAAQQQAGRRAWVAARAVPWRAWLQTLWLDALAAGAVLAPRTLIADGAAAHLWDRIVAQAAPDLFDPGGAAAQAAQAWGLFHAWRRPDDSFDGWSRAGIGDDAAAFSGWARRYRALLAEREVVDMAQAADRLAAIATHVPAWRGREVMICGFIELTPQQRRLVMALRDAGAAVVERGLARVPESRRYRVTSTTPAEELATAIAWARERALADPAATVGIVIDDLAARRDEVVACADDILCPELASRVLPDAPRPYDVSLGIALADVPAVATALALISLGVGSLAATEAAVVLRSAYLPDAQNNAAPRAAVERRWRELGTRTVTLADIVRALATVDPALAERWRRVPVTARSLQPPTQWANDWRALLAALGWPGDHTLGSGEWQACEAWSRLLAEFGALVTVTPTLSRSDALAALRTLSVRTIFQPQAPPARISILGALEASGLQFDALWITGMSADVWPPSSQPNPMLPLAWQRERHVLRSDPAAELAHARALIEGFGGAARTVIASHARVIDGFPRTGSALVAEWPPYDGELPPPRGLAHSIAEQCADVAACIDERAPPLPGGSSVRGGVGVVESQSACPFQAFARHRLRSDAWPEASEGLTPMERGILLHAALAAFWDSVRDHATLCALSGSELDSRIADAAAHARTRIDRQRWQSLPAAVVEGEPQRLAATLRAWLDVIERHRTPFTVRDTELKLPLQLGGVAISLRIDRVDTLVDGGAAIIDYKGGRATEPRRWFAPRPSGTQLGQYALALRAETQPPVVRAAIYAQLKPGEIKIEGLAADESVWPPAKTPAQARGVPFATWSEIEAAWETRLDALAGNFREGVAAVAPRDGQCCKRCELQPLCRIQTLSDASAATEDIADA
jgi:ATP-dependent helicase/nuclease subunit B